MPPPDPPGFVDALENSAKSGVILVEAVAQEMDFAADGGGDGHLYAGDETDAFPGQNVAEGSKSIDGIVIGQRGGANSGRGQAFGDDVRRQFAVA
jgi:hypothetical protein